MLRILAALAVTLLLSGCTSAGESSGDQVMVQSSEIAPEGGATKPVDCRGPQAMLEVQSPVGTNGSFSVSVTSGSSTGSKGPGAFNGRFYAVDGADVAEDLVGNPGVWHLRVDKIANFDSTFTVTLTCL